MNRFTWQKKYRFRPPKHSALLGPLFHGIAKLLLRCSFKVGGIRVEGMDRVVELVRAGESLLIAPNHGNHPDPAVLFKLGRCHRIPFHFMATRETFESSRVRAFILQRCGVFSVDRDGGDISSIKTAIQIIQKCGVPLVIFPEGEIYHHHEKLDALNEGVATILIRALDKFPEHRTAYLVPTAIQYRWCDSVSAQFSARLDRLEGRVVWKPRPNLDPVQRIYRLGDGLLSLKEVEFLGQARAGPLPERLACLRIKIVEQVERKHLGQGLSGNIPERVKQLRARILKQLAQSDAPDVLEHQQALEDDLDSLFVAVQLYSYPGQYLLETPSVHRIAETILKLEEDVFGKALCMGPQFVNVQFGEPLDVKEFLREGCLNTRTGVGPLTSWMSCRIQRMLEELNARFP